MKKLFKNFISWFNALAKDWGKTAEANPGLRVYLRYKMFNRDFRSINIFNKNKKAAKK